MHNYQQLNLKNKPYTQAKQEQNHRYGDYLEGYQLEGEGREWGKGVGIKKYKLVCTK